MLRVADQYLPIKAGDNTKGLLRVIMYLEDMGPSVTQSQIDSNSHQDSEQQVVWQLEMWKRAEMAKFLVHLKQKEIQRIEEVTSDWKQKELVREQTFSESLQKVVAA